MPLVGRDIIVIGASAGGVQALQRLVAALPADLSAAVFIVLHLWPGGESFLSEILQRAGPLPVSTAKDDAPIERGKVFVAPVDFHLFVERGRMLVRRGPRENRARPAINPLFRSAATAYRNRVIGVILTGTLDDGAAGLWAIKQCGGLAIVQSDPAFDQMPQSALENVSVDYHVPLAEIAPLLHRLSREHVEAVEVAPVPEVVRIGDEDAKMKVADFKIDTVGRRTFFNCPECNGALWEVTEGSLEYRCHVGHAYSAEILRDAQGRTIEASLWSAVRALKESAALDGRLAERAAQHQLDQAAEAHRRNAQTKMEQVGQLQAFMAALRTEK